MAEDFDGEVVALNLNTGLYFSLPGLAGAVWRDLNAGHPVEPMVEELSAAGSVLGRDARAFISSMIAHGLLRETVDPGTPSSEPQYRQMIARGDFDLTFTAHDDMKDLVMTDPIHEVDESAGWPVLRAGG